MAYRPRAFYRTLMPKVILALLICIAIAGTVLTPLVQADRFDDQIRALSQNNAGNREATGNLEDQENSLSAVLASLQARISAIEMSIRENKAKSEDLKKQIAEAEAEIERQRAVLGVNIKQMYLDDDVSTIEMMASSQNLSEYFDKETYRASVQNKIKSTMERINALKKQLEEQKTTVEKLLADQIALQSQLDAERNEQNRLLSLNQSQQASFESDIKANNSKIAELRRQQAIENAKNFVGGWQTGGSGGYPWANAPFPNTIADPWGMYLRQCVSYTAWKVASSGRYMPYWGGHGNANQWDNNARAAGIPVDTIPQPGDVAVSNAGIYGHVMYVESVNGDGTITVSQYNAGWDGRYSMGRRTTSGLVFIHF
jgi:surface antigen